MTKYGRARVPSLIMLATVLALSCSAVWAQQANDYLTQSTITKLHGLDLWYGQYVRNSSIGALHYSARSEGNNIVVSSSMRLSIGGTVGRTEEQELVIGPDLQLQRYTLHGESPTDSLIVDQTLSREGNGTYQWSEVRKSGKGDSARTASNSLELDKNLPEAPSLEMAWLLIGLADWQPGIAEKSPFLERVTRSSTQPRSVF